MIEPTEADIGRAVVYQEHRDRGVPPPPEEGVITSLGHMFVYVTFTGFTKARAMRREQLEWKDMTLSPQTQRTFGQRAVGLDFNPSGDPLVAELKELYAKIIDICNDKRTAIMQHSEAHRLWSIAVTQAQDAQMWAVKAATWRD